MRRVLERLRVPALCLLAAAAPLGAWLKLSVPGTSLDHRPVAVGLFDLAVWPALLLVLLLRLLKGGPRFALRPLLAAPPPAWLLLGLAAWSGLAWPRLLGEPPGGLTAVLKAAVQIAEYGIVAFVVFAELAAVGERARQWALAVLAAVLALVIGCGAAQYFSGPEKVPDFFVGSIAGHRNALGALLAVAGPFAVVMAVGPGGCCCTWRWLWAALAAGGVLVTLSGGALLGLVCGALFGAALLGRRRLAVAAAVLLVLLAGAQMLPRRNLTAAIGSVSLTRENPRTGERQLALRYLRAGSELNVLKAGLSEKQLWFGAGPGRYDRVKERFRPKLDDRFAAAAGQTDRAENYDVLADEPGSFNLFGVAGAELGLLGLLGFLWLFAWWAGRALGAWRKAPGEGEASLAAGACAAVLGAAVAGVFTSTWVQGAAPTLVLLVALAAAQGDSGVEVLRGENGTAGGPAPLPGARRPVE